MAEKYESTGSRFRFTTDIKRNYIRYGGVDFPLNIRKSYKISR